MSDRVSRFLAFIAYLVPVVAPCVLLGVRSRDTFVRFHAVQSLGVSAAAVGAFVAWAVAGWIISLVPYYGFLFAVVLFALVIGVWLVLVGLTIVGMVNALSLQTRRLPVIGEWVGRLAVRLLPGNAVG